MKYTGINFLLFDKLISRLQLMISSGTFKLTTWDDVDDGVIAM